MVGVFHRLVSHVRICRHRRPDLVGRALADKLKETFPRTFVDGEKMEVIVRKNLSMVMYERSPRQFHQHAGWDERNGDERLMEDIAEFSRIWKLENEQDVRRWTYWRCLVGRLLTMFPILKTAAGGIALFYIVTSFDGYFVGKMAGRLARSKYESSENADPGNGHDGQFNHSTGGGCCGWVGSRAKRQIGGAGR